MEISGKKGEKIIFIFRNPFHVDFGFYASSSSRKIVFSDIPSYREPGCPENIFIIKGRSQLRMKAEIVGEVSNEEYVVLSDYLHHIISIYKMKVKN
jgi:hypothetical protein